MGEKNYFYKICRQLIATTVKCSLKTLPDCKWDTLVDDKAMSR